MYKLYPTLRAAAVATVVLSAASSIVLASEVGELKTFTAGTKATAADVNKNFADVKAAVNDNNNRIGALEPLFVPPAPLAAVPGQAVPQLLSYQGRLTDSIGQPIPTADYDIEVRIYGSPESEDLKWGPQTFPNVPVAKGFFGLILGPTDIDGKNIVQAFNDGNAYVDVRYNNTTMRPRHQLVSAPYALRAGDGVPPGGVLAFNLAECPVGWTEFTDARGNFIRGLDRTGTVDPGRTLRSFQDEQIKEHRHAVGLNGADSTALANDGGTQRFPNFSNDCCGAGGKRETDTTGGSETRPRNIALLYCVKQ